MTALIGLFRGQKHRTPFIRGLSFGGYCDRCPEKRTDCDWLTKDTAIVDKYCADPFCNYVFTASAYMDLMKILDYVNTDKGTANLNKKLPYLFIAGQEDPVGSYGKGVAESAELFIKAGCENVGVKLYPDDRHELLNELDRETVAADIIAFADGVVAACGTSEVAAQSEQ